MPRFEFYAGSRRQAATVTVKNTPCLSKLVGAIIQGRQIPVAKKDKANTGKTEVKLKATKAKPNSGPIVFKLDRKLCYQ